MQSSVMSSANGLRDLRRSSYGLTIVLYVPEIVNNVLILIIIIILFVYLAADVE